MFRDRNVGLYGADCCWILKIINKSLSGQISKYVLFDFFLKFNMV